MFAFPKENAFPDGAWPNRGFACVVFELDPKSPPVPALDPAACPKENGEADPEPAC